MPASQHPFHLHSGNAEDVTERLDKGLLDFGLLIEPADIKKYDYIRLPAKILGASCCGRTIRWRRGPL